MTIINLFLFLFHATVKKIFFINLLQIIWRFSCLTWKLYFWAISSLLFTPNSFLRTKFHSRLPSSSSDRWLNVENIFLRPSIQQAQLCACCRLFLLQHGTWISTEKYFQAIFKIKVHFQMWVVDYLAIKTKICLEIILLILISNT